MVEVYMIHDQPFRNLASLFTFSMVSLIMDRGDLIRNDEAVKHISSDQLNALESYGNDFKIILSNQAHYTE